MSAGPVPVEVLRYWRSKGIRPGFDYRDVWEEEHDTAFTAAKFMRTDVLEAMSTSLDRAVAEGIPYDRWRTGVSSELQRLGFWGIQRVTDPDSGEEMDIDVPRRLRTIFETNTRTARAAGQWERIERTKRTSPYLLYMVGPSLVHREEHLAWHGVCLHADDPWWVTHFPPNGYGCKCHVRQITERERDRLLRDGIPAAERTRLENGELGDERTTIRTEAPEVIMRLWDNRRTGETMLVPEGIAPGFAHRPTQRLREPPPRGTPPSPAAPPPVSTPRTTTRAPSPSGPRDAARGQVDLASDAATALRELAVATPRRGGAAQIRGSLRRLVQTAHPELGSFDLATNGPRRDELRSDASLAQRGIRGLHGSDGVIIVESSVLRTAREGLAAHARGSALSDAQRSAIRTLVHEEMHGHSPIGARTYVGSARVVEEVSNEMLARTALERAGLYSAQQVAEMGAYQDWIERFASTVERHVPAARGESREALLRRIVDASVRFRTRPTRLAGEQRFTNAFAEALGVDNAERFLQDVRLIAE